MQRLSEVVAGVRSTLDAEIIGDEGAMVGSITHDSRVVVPGALFCCVPGTTVDGHHFADQAVKDGAHALLVERRLSIAVPQILVGDVRASMGFIAASVLRHPCDSLTMVGVTGTNGKTTVSQIMARILEVAGMPCGVVGTLSGARTTPESPELMTRLAEFLDSGRTAASLEVSSHALALGRVDGCRFDVAIFTNLGRDHLDLHGTEERYFAAKAKLFDRSLSDAAVINIDDAHGQLLADVSAIPVDTYSMRDVSDVTVEADRVRFTWRGQAMSVRLGGRFNVLNALAAAAAAARLGIALDVIAEGLATVDGVAGRFERVNPGGPFAVIVDYAHTPDGLDVALRAARDVSPGAAVHVVFGCGGERDEEKRPEMGRVAAELADRVVITSDNPRRDDPLAIIASVRAGVAERYLHRVVDEPDRRAAIALAIASARPGDVVLIAGKGHEATQTIGTVAHPFDDRVVARELLETMT